MPQNYFDYCYILSQVMKDKIYHSFWKSSPAQTIMKPVERIYPEGSYYSYMRDLIATEPTQIQSNIFLGSAFNAADQNWLQKNNIEVIVNVTPGISNYFPDQYKYYNFDQALDITEATLKPYYEQFYEIMEENVPQGRRILVHCFAGRSRSTSLVLYYLMRKFNWTLDVALAYLKERRPIININKKFIEEIKELLVENALF